MTFIYGINPVKEALYAGRRKIDKILISERKDEGIRGKKKEIIHLAQRQRITLAYMEPSQITIMVGTDEHQGVVAFIQEKEFVSLKYLLERVLSQKDDGILLILDGVEDPRNFGSIIRSAVAFGVTGMVIARKRNARLTPAVAKAASGGLEYVEICQVVNISRTIEMLKDKGLWVWGLDAKGEKRIDLSALEGPLAMVVGAEGRGLRHLVKESCDGCLKIPLRKEISSFNVSIACSLALYEFRRKRGFVNT